MQNARRRTFLFQVVALGSAMCAGPKASTTTIEESEPQAMAVGYKADTFKVDAKAYPKHAVTQNCSNCSLFQAKAIDPLGGCAVFPGKQVARSGWCSAWVQKTA